MEYYFLLASATTVIVVLLLALYRRLRDFGVIVGIGALYYWSLYGGWFVVTSAVLALRGTRFSFFPFLWAAVYSLVLAAQAGLVFQFGSVYGIILFVLAILALFASLIGLLAAFRTTRRAAEEESVQLVSLPKSYIAWFVLAVTGASFAAAGYVKHIYIFVCSTII